MFIIISTLLALDRCSEDGADRLLTFFNPALNWIQRWLPLFYVPTLVVLPQALEGIAGEPRLTSSPGFASISEPCAAGARWSSTVLLWWPPGPCRPAKCCAGLQGSLLPASQALELSGLYRRRVLLHRRLMPVHGCMCASSGIPVPENICPVAAIANAPVPRMVQAQTQARSWLLWFWKAGCPSARMANAQQQSCLLCCMRRGVWAV